MIPVGRGSAKCYLVSAVTVSPRAVSVGFGSVLDQIPRFRFGSVFLEHH
jgi:hypothetical protein